MPDKYRLLDPDVIANPYPVYKRLRTENPVYWHEEMQRWMISRYSDVVALMTDERFSYISPNQEGGEAYRSNMKTLSSLVMFHEPVSRCPLGGHIRLRNLLEKAFYPSVPKMKERIEEVVGNLLDKTQENGCLEIVEDLIYPLTSAVHSDFLGVPESDSEQIRKCLAPSARFVFGIAYPPTTPEDDQAALEGDLALANYFRQFAEQRRQNPEDDLITALVQVDEQGDKLTLEEVQTNLILLAMAGYPVSTIAHTNSLFALLSNPSQVQKLQDDPNLIDSAIEELLRYETLLQWIPRCANEDVELHGHLIRKNQFVLLGLGSANRDETQFTDPDRLDITRKDNSNLGFGYGPHLCLGAPLGRLYLKAIIPILLSRLGNLRLDVDNVERLTDSCIVRNLKSVPVKFEASRKEVSV